MHKTINYILLNMGSFGNLFICPKMGSFGVHFISFFVSLSYHVLICPYMGSFNSTQQLGWMIRHTRYITFCNNLLAQFLIDQGPTFSQFQKLFSDIWTHTMLYQHLTDISAAKRLHLLCTDKSNLQIFLIQDFKMQTIPPL